MSTKILSTLTITVSIVFGYMSLSNAQEIVLCLNSTDQYVVTVNEKGNCIEGEEQIVMSGSRTVDLQKLTPVTVFEDYEECDTQGSVRKLGFDKNGNNSLDEDEIEIVAKTCANPVDEESDE